MTKDDRFLHICVPADDADHAKWSLVNGIRLPERFAVIEFTPEKRSRVCVEYEFVTHADTGTVKSRSVLLTGLGDAQPTAQDFRTLRPEESRQHALEYFERVDWEHWIKPGWDPGGSAPKARAFPSARTRTAGDLDVVAKLYEDALADPERTDTPAQVVAAALGVSETTADRRIRAARRAHKIESTPARGRKPQA